MSAIEETEMLSKPETVKDTVQVMVESGATRVGHVASIITKAVVDVAKEVGGFATDLFEMREAAKRAQDADKSGRDDSAG